MEVMGQFASILAHDLRNYLNAVRWSADLLASEIDAADSRRRDVDQIRSAADGGIGMIRNILGFARPEGSADGSTDLRAHLGQIGGIVARLVGPSVAVEVEVPDDIPTVAISSAGVTQILFNLAANARDAMPDGGRFRIGAEAIRLTGAEPSATADPIVPGRFVRLTVADSGEGMDAQTASRAFEAFYTTRDATDAVAGTGLGLSSVYLIVTRAGGRIDLRSEPGLGTTFTIDLPAA
jgi:signal transduction histidine kinase